MQIFIDPLKMCHVQDLPQVLYKRTLRFFHASKAALSILFFLHFQVNHNEIVIARYVDTLRGVQDWTEMSEPSRCAPASPLRGVQEEKKQ